MDFEIDFANIFNEPWLSYAVHLNILDKPKDSLLDLKALALKDEKIISFLADVKDFHSTVVANHKNPDLPIHKLLFLLDLGFTADNTEIDCAINEILSRKDEHGVYQSCINIPKHYGGSGENTFGWSLCDAPLLLLALIKAGVDYEQHISKGVEYLSSLHSPQGFLCIGSKELGKFRGPGRKDDCCPYATLLMLKLFADIPKYLHSSLALSTAHVLLDLWSRSFKTHPYMFYMGTDFRKLKAPAMWYDIINVVDTLSYFEEIRSEKVFLEMLNIIQSKQNSNGLFTPESIYMRMKGWDFSQKKQPSPYLTYLCLKIFKRCNIFIYF